MQIVTLQEAQSAPVWRRPIFLLFVMAAAMPIAFATWSALLNNFVIEVANFDGADIGLLHSVREIPGFLAVGVIAIIIFLREQVLGLLSLVLLGVATAVTAWFPQMGGILTLTLLSSIGFHYYETVNQSLQLQWISKAQAPQVLGWLLAMGSAGSLVAFGVIVVTWEWLALSFNTAYMIAGGTTAAIALACMVLYPQFQSPTPQHKTMVLRKRYWLYYALQFMAGARRQIFMVFAGFMMVERFGFDVHELTSLYLINLVMNMFIGPVFGRVVARYGERNTLIFEYAGLAAGVFDLWRHLHVWLGCDAGGGVICDRSPVFLTGLCPENLFPKDCRSGRYRPNGRSGLYHQPYRGSRIAGVSGTSVAVFTQFGVYTGCGHGADVAGAGFVNSEASRTGL